MTDFDLPIETLKLRFLEALGEGPVVVTSPTGSGKSTQVPRWCLHRAGLPGGDGVESGVGPRVLVVEPRRVACRGLAQRVAELEGSELKGGEPGGRVGYHVRDDPCLGEDTRLVFATPGIVLRMGESLGRYGVVILDELHERSLDVDLLLPLLMERRSEARLVVMSATLEGERVARHLGGRHLHAEGRTFPVRVEYLPGANLLPEARGLETRVARAVERGLEHPGDLLVFLPGKGEIAGVADGLRHRSDLEVLPLHGGLSLAEQARVFRPLPQGGPKRRKVILATNVAETSITVPGVGVVIDSGLVRRTRYHQGRGFLTLAAVAADSAEQRAGRAGRTAPGVCLRLWDEAAQLEPRTPPEIHRESLVPLVLGAAFWGKRAEELPFLDPPKEHALAAAHDELERLGAFGPDGALTAQGRELFGLPLDAPLGRLLVEGREREAGGGEEAAGLLADLIDLVSALAVDRPLLARTRRDEEENRPPAKGGDPVAALAVACDAVALIDAVRTGKGAAKGAGLDMARDNRRRLRNVLGRPFGDSGLRPSGGSRLDRKRLALAVLAADPAAAYLPRRRGRRIAWANGGTEIELGRESRAGELEDELEALVALETRALGLGGGETRVLLTAAMPVPLAWLVEAGVGRDRLGRPRIEGGRAVAVIERVHARRVLAIREEVPRGPLARQALSDLFLEGGWLPGTADEARERLEAAGLAAGLARSERPEWRDEIEALYAEGIPTLEAWTAERLEALGVESGDDAALLGSEDLLPPQLGPLVLRDLGRDYPRALLLAGSEYRLTYDLPSRTATLEQLTGRKAALPSVALLPRVPGFRLVFRFQERVQTLRER